MLNTVPNRIEYAGNGTSAVFAWPYRVNSPTHLGVMIFNSSGAQPAFITPQFLNTDFTFSATADPSGVYPSGGNIIFNSSPNAQSVIVMFRSSVVTNDFFIPQNGPIPATAANNEFDYLTMLIQRSQDLNTRSMRLPDGLPGTVDMTLPSNIFQSNGKRPIVVVNSSGLSWSFDETLQQYLPNTLAYATNNSSLTSLPGAASGLYLISNGSSAPSWSGIIIVPGSLVGVVPVVNGGTGTGSSFTRGVPIFSGTSSIYAPMTGVFWDEAEKTLRIGSGVVAFLGLPLANGPLRTVGSGIVTVGSTALSNEVAGTLGVEKGGTGTATSSMIQYGVLYASSATQVGIVPSSAAGNVLTANGSSAPTYQPVSTTNTVTRKTSAATALTSENTIILSGSSWTLNLWDAVGNSGRAINLMHDGSSFVQVYTIVASGAQTIGRFGNSIKMHTREQTLRLESDGANFYVANSKTNTPWAPYAATFNGFGSVTVHYAFWRRTGDSMEIDVKWTAATVTASEARVIFPDNLALSANSSRVSSALTYVGHCAPGLMGTNTYLQWALVEPLTFYCVFGRQVQTQTDAPLTKVAGNVLTVNNSPHAMKATIPMNEWIP